MRDINSVEISGNLTADPVAKEIQNSDSVMTQCVVASHRYLTDMSGEKKVLTNFVRCVIFNSLGQKFLQFAHKGDKVLVKGRLDCHVNENGLTSYSVIVENFDILRSATTSPKIEE